MKINRPGNLDIIKAYSNQLQKNGGKAKAAETKRAEADTVEISSKAKEMQNIRAKLADLPEVRQDKVEALKQQIQEGTYRPDGEKIAAGIAEERTLDKRV